MADATNQTDGPCGTGCTRCGLEVPPTDAAALSGWRLTVSSLAVFILPLAVAVLGAVLAGGGGAAQGLGALGGLVVGAGAGAGISRLVCRNAKEAA